MCDRDYLEYDKGGSILRSSVYRSSHAQAVSSFIRCNVLIKKIPTIALFSSENFPVEGRLLSVGQR